MKRKSRFSTQNRYPFLKWARPRSSSSSSECTLNNPNNARNSRSTSSSSNSAENRSSNSSLASSRQSMQDFPESSEDEACFGKISLYSLIEETFRRLNLSAIQRSTIYDLLNYVKNLRDINSLPKTYKEMKKTLECKSLFRNSYKYCRQKEDLAEITHKCNNDGGILHVFNLEESIRKIVRENGNYLAEQNKGQNEFVRSDVYKEIWNFPADNYSIMRITLILNIDDAPLTKSTKLHMTPISFIVGELPHEVRFLQKNMYLSAIWVGKDAISRRVMWTEGFLQEFLRLQDLSLNVTFSSQEYIVQVKIGLIIMDSVEKAKTLNMKGHNGFDSCSICYHHGKRLALHPKGSKHVYPFIKIHDLIMRSPDSYRSDADLAERVGKPFKGIKGNSILHDHIYLPQQVPIDWMHCVLLGIVKNLLKFYINGRLVQETDKLIEKTKFPHDFRRKPESLSNLAKFKAHVFKIWLFILPPILHGLISSDKFALFFILSFTMREMCKTSVSKHTINHVSQIVEKLCEAYEQVCGLVRMVPNVHFLQHIPLCVDMCGSLPDCSAFAFESLLYTLKKRTFGTRYEANQIKRNYIESKQEYKSISQDFPELPRSLQLLSASKELVFEQVKSCKINDTLTRSLLSVYGLNNLNSCSYYTCSRVYYKKQVFHSKSYKKRQQSASYIVSYKNRANIKSFGHIEKFILKSSNNIMEKDILVHITKLKSYKSRNFFINDLPQNKILKNLVRNTNLDHFIRVQETLLQDVVPLTSILHRLILVPVSGSADQFYATELDFVLENQ